MRPLSVMVYYGGELKCTETRGDRQVFDSVVVYAADPWHTPALASINRFYIRGNVDVPMVCAFSTGDGIGGTESRIGRVSSAQACAALVLETEPAANGATYSTAGTGECFAEFGMTGQNDSPSCQTCCLE